MKTKKAILMDVNYPATVKPHFAIDSSDHFDLLCGQCHNAMEVVEVNQYKVQHLEKVGPAMIIYAVCDDCKAHGHVKCYWDSPMRGNHYLATTIREEKG